MRLLVTFFFVLMLGLLGCSTGTYQVPKEEFRQQVRTLGVLPIMVDPGSTITHPQRSDVVDLLRRHSSARDERLRDMLREEGSFFDVRPVSGRPQALFSDLVRGRSLAGEKGRTHYAYSFDRQAVERVAAESVADGLLVVILNGVERQEKRWDRTRLNYLEAPYNSIVATAMVVSRNGEILWESTPEDVFLLLQYPDFDEAYYNKMDAVQLKYITLEGLERTLTEPRGGLFGRSAFPRVYFELFEKITTGLKPGFINPLKKKDAGQPAKEEG